MQKLLTFFFSKNISVYAVLNDQSFNDTLSNVTVSFEQLGPDCHQLCQLPVIKVCARVYVCKASHLGQTIPEHVFRHMQTGKAQINLSTHAV